MSIKNFKIQVVGTNVIARDENGDIYETFIESEKVLLRSDVIENHLPENHHLISVEKKKDEILIPEYVIEALKKGQELQVLNNESEEQ